MAFEAVSSAHWCRDNDSGLLMFGRTFLQVHVGARGKSAELLKVTVEDSQPHFCFRRWSTLFRCQMLKERAGAVRAAHADWLKRKEAWLSGSNGHRSASVGNCLLEWRLGLLLGSDSSGF